MTISKQHYLAEYDNELKAVRRAVRGAAVVKKHNTEHLKNPSTIPSELMNSDEQKIAAKRYESFVAHAEFDEFTGQTEDVMIGKMAFDDAVIELPDRLNYLMESSDGDGLSFNGLLEHSARNILEAKWHCVVADYQGLANVDISSASKADIEAANPKVVFKSYPRESVVFTDYKVINNTKQLSLIVFYECGVEVDHKNLSENKVESYLYLGLDENGNYYQRKEVYGSTGESQSDTGEIPVTVGGSPLKFIPIYIASDEELTSGGLPQELGYLSKISDVCYYRYWLSATFNEAMAKFVPTVFINNMDTQAYDDFKKINGRSSINWGGSNVLPPSNGGEQSVAAALLSANGTLEDFHKKFAETIDKLRSLGASIPSEGSSETATKAKIDSGQQNAVLKPLANNLEKMAKMLVLYAGMFEGLWNQESLEMNTESFSLSLNKEFENVKASAEEVNAVLAIYMNGLYSREHTLTMLEQMGWTPKDAEDMLTELDAEPEL